MNKDVSPKASPEWKLKVEVGKSLPIEPVPKDCDCFDCYKNKLTEPRVKFVKKFKDFEEAEMNFRTGLIIWGGSLVLWLISIFIWPHQDWTNILGFATFFGAGVIHGNRGQNY